MRELFLHIGTEKTGSTSIQKCLIENKGHLLDNGFYVLESDLSSNNRDFVGLFLSTHETDELFSLNGIRTEAKFNNFKKEYFDKLEVIFNDLPTNIEKVVISAEHFHSRITSINEIIELKTYLSAWFNKINIVCYIRDQSSLCESIYSTLIKSGQTITISEHIENCHKNNKYYNYDEMLKPWEEVFGTDSINLSIFDRNELIERDVVKDFFYLVGIPMSNDLKIPEKHENQSLSHVGLTFGRLINMVFPLENKFGLPNRQRYRIFTELMAKYSGRTALLTREECLEIEREFSTSNSNINTKYFNKKSDLFALKDYDTSFDKLINLRDGLDISSVTIKHVMRSSTSLFDTVFYIVQIISRLLLPSPYKRLQIKNSFEKLKGNK